MYVMRYCIIGHCTHIPQLPEEDKDKILSNPLTRVDSYPAHISGDMLWAYIPLIGTKANYDTLPEELFPVLKKDNVRVVTRDFPYSFDFLIENFLDPAHVPYAHHMLQGTRDDGSPIKIEFVSDINDPSRCEFKFEDRSSGKIRRER